ncbi:MAG: hypothetical protein QXO70_04915 [Candidatus Pacearchaeota archaeon]
MENTQQELMIKVMCWKLNALNQLIDEYAYKNRAKIVQKLLEQKHQVEKKLELNKHLEAQYGLQNPFPKGLLLGEISHITDHDKGGKKDRGFSIEEPLSS